VIINFESGRDWASRNPGNFVTGMEDRKIKTGEAGELAGVHHIFELASVGASDGLVAIFCAANANYERPAD